MKLILNKKGSIFILNIILILIVVSFYIGLVKIHKNSINLLKKQNIYDAHAFSIISYYVYTANEISWTNKKLKQLSVLFSIVSKVKALAPIAAAVKFLNKTIKMYQNYLLLKIKIDAKVQDLSLRTKNKINLIPNYHYLNYRRQKNINPFSAELIEFKNSIFTSACVKHQSVVNINTFCIDSKDYSNNNKLWFAPIKETWRILIK